MKINRTAKTLLAGCLALAAWAAVSPARPGRKSVTMITKSTPILHVRSVEPSLKFWTERFGFKPTIQVPEGNHLGFVALENGPLELMYQTFEGMRTAPDNPLAEAVDKGPSFIFMEVPDIQATIKALDGAEMVKGLHDTFYGAKEVVAREPGGHFIIFSQLPAQTQK